MKKRLLAGVLGVMMTGAMVLPVCAEEPQIQVEYKQESKWEVSIPKTTLSQERDKEQTVLAKEVNIRPELKLQVKITGITDGTVTLTRSDGKETTTSIVSYMGTPIDGDTVIAEFVDQSTEFANGTTGTLSFSKIPADTKAGDYTGTVTYVMETVSRQ